MASTRTIPITIMTGYVGSGKTTLILNLIPQLRAKTPGYRLALIKNEIGDLNVDSRLADAAEMSGTRELLGACICCSNVGQIGESLDELEREYAPDRVIIETSGSAEPIKLVMEIKRLGAERAARSAPDAVRYELDGIVSVVDVVNWTGYASTSFTAKLQARQTDLIVLNKWEDAGEEACERCLDRLGDMDVETPHVRSDRGWINVDLLFGLDARSGFDWEAEQRALEKTDSRTKDAEGHGHTHHMEEMECLSITLAAGDNDAAARLDAEKLNKLLASAPKDEIFRIKAVVALESTPVATSCSNAPDVSPVGRYILNWAFGRYTWTPVGEQSKTAEPEPVSGPEPLLRMSIFTARHESIKWQKRLEAGQYVDLSAGHAESTSLTVKRVL